MARQPDRRLPAVLDYPQTWDSFAWGTAIGIAAVIGFGAARAAARQAMPELVALADCARRGLRRL